MTSFLLAAGRLPETFSRIFANKKGSTSHLVIQTHKGNVYFHQSFKKGHLEVEVLGQIIHISTGAQLRRKTWLRILY